MEEALIQRLEDSFKLLAPRGPELMDRFYANLFAKHPAVRSMFPTDMSGQKQKLLASLTLVNQNIRSPERLSQPLYEMGRRHAGYGAQEPHYQAVRDTLVGVMSDMAGDAWNDQLTSDWKAALDFVNSVMLEGNRAALADGVESPAQG